MHSPGSERFRNKEIQVKTAGGAWVGKHIFLWEQVNGKLPEGYRIMFADQNKSNFELDNLIPVTMREIFYMNRHGLITTNKELTKAGLALARHSIAIMDKLSNLHNQMENLSNNLVYKGKIKNGHYTIKRKAELLGFLEQEKNKERPHVKN